MHAFTRAAAMASLAGLAGGAAAAPESTYIGLLGVGGGTWVLDTVGSGFDTEIGLWEDDGVLIGADDDGANAKQQYRSRIDATLGGGNYMVSVSGYNSSGYGDGYAVAVDGGSASGSWSFNVDGAQRAAGSVGSGEADWVSFSVARDLGAIAYDTETFSVNTFGSGFDTELGLWSSAGTLLADNDDFNGLQSQIADLNLAAGDYYVAVGRYNTSFGDGFSVTPDSRDAGQYTINAAQATSSDELSNGQAEFFRFTILDDIADYRFDLGVIEMESWPIEITTDGSGFDTEIGVYDQNGDRVLNDDDGGEGLRSSTALTSFDAGTYTLYVSSYNTIWGATEGEIDVSGANGSGDWQINITDLDGGDYRTYSPLAGTIGVNELVAIQFEIVYPAPGAFTLAGLGLFAAAPRDRRDRRDHKN